MKAGVINIQHPVQTSTSPEQIRTRVSRELALQQDHSTIGTVHSSKHGHIYTTLTGRLLDSTDLIILKQINNLASILFDQVTKAMLIYSLFPHIQINHYWVLS